MRSKETLKLFFYFFLKPTLFIKISKDAEYQRTHKIRRAIWQSFLIVIGCFLLGFIFVFFIHLPHRLSPWLVLIGTGIILWATLGGFLGLGWEIQSWVGNTLPEQITKIWLKILYFFGTFLIFVGILCGVKG